MAIVLNGIDQYIRLTGSGLAFDTTYQVEITLGATHFPSGLAYGSTNKTIVSTYNVFRGEHTAFMFAAEDNLRLVAGTTFKIGASPTYVSGDNPLASTLETYSADGALITVTGVNIPSTYGENVPLITLFGSINYNNSPYDPRFFLEAEIDQVVIKDAAGTTTLATFDLTTPAASYTYGNYDLTVVNYSASDTTPPTFDAGPTVTATSGVGHTFSATINENGSVYSVRLASGAAAPSAAQVKAGTDASDAALGASEKNTTVLIASTATDITYTGGTVSTAYDYYFVAEDEALNLQASAIKVSASTSAGSVAIDSNAFTSGSAFTGTYSGIGSISSPITLTDSAGNTLDIAITDGGDGTYSAANTETLLPTTGSKAGLLFGTVDITGGA